MTTPDADETCVESCPICTEPPTVPDAWDGRWPAARWSPDAPAGVTDRTEHQT